MLKICPVCKNKAEMRSNQKYCSRRCKKRYENSLRNAPGKRVKTKVGDAPLKSQLPSVVIKRPQSLNLVAAEYWDKVAPTATQRGHLNVLSEDAFAELCDLHSKLVDINKIMNTGQNTLFQKTGIDKQDIKESVLSDLKRKYSRQYLDYCKAFYLTPLSNRGDFGLQEGKETEEDTKERFFK